MGLEALWRPLLDHSQSCSCWRLRCISCHRTTGTRWCWLYSWHSPRSGNIARPLSLNTQSNNGATHQFICTQKYRDTTCKWSQLQGGFSCRKRHSHRVSEDRRVQDSGFCWPCWAPRGHSGPCSRCSGPPAQLLCRPPLPGRPGSWGVCTRARR